MASEDLAVGIAETHYCPRCERELPAAAFDYDVKRDRWPSYCRMCTLASKRIANMTPAQVAAKRARGRARTELDRERDRNRHERDRAQRNAARRARHRLTRYGLTQDDFDVLYATQGGCCYLCARAISEEVAKVDHDHNTGLARGLLCQSCNVKLAAVDDVEWLQRALAYVADPPAQRMLAPSRLG